MEIFQFVANLRLRHPALEADAITVAMGMQPRRIWSAGKPMTTPRGVRWVGRQRRLNWTSLAVRGEEDDLRVPFNKPGIPVCPSL